MAAFTSWEETCKYVNKESKIFTEKRALSEIHQFFISEYWFEIFCQLILVDMLHSAFICSKICWLSQKFIKEFCLIHLFSANFGACTRNFFFHPHVYQIIFMLPFGGALVKFIRKLKFLFLKKKFEINCWVCVQK